MPRLFAHEHFATLDGPLTAAWVLAWATFAPRCATGRLDAAVWTGAGADPGCQVHRLAGAAAVCGLDRVVPAAAAECGRWRSVCPMALAVFVALNPPLWHEPLTGLRTFFDLNLNRAEQGHLNVTTWFLGRMYNLDHPLPWYNTLVWTVVTITPVTAVPGHLWHRLVGPPLARGRRPACCWCASGRR